MITIQNYVKVKSLEEAYELNQKRSARVMGGMMWMRLSSRRVPTVIDLSGLSLDKIEETEDEYKIGCMTTLRDLENHKGLNDMTDGAIKESLRHIVGVQFRNLATVGGSIAGRFGFSDVLTMFLALESYVELYKGGVISMQEFAERKKDNDILVNIIVKKNNGKYAYFSQRNTKTDFPVLACALGMIPGKPARAVIGARPQKAVVIEDSVGILKDGITEEAAIAFGAYVASRTTFGSNMRASAEYRSMIAEALIKRACLKIGEGR